MSAPVRVTTPSTPEQWAAGRRLLLDYFDWLAPAAKVESVPAVQPSARAELADLAGTYRRPGHRFLLGTQGQLAVGMVGLRPGDDPCSRREVELVRFFSRPAARGSGVGTALLTAAIAAARSMGYERVVLDTVPAFMATAVRLYERHGFTRSTDPHGLPVPDGARFALDLGDPIPSREILVG